MSRRSGVAMGLLAAVGVVAATATAAVLVLREEKKRRLKKRSQRRRVPSPSPRKPPTEQQIMFSRRRQSELRRDDLHSGEGTWEDYEVSVGNFSGISVDSFLRILHNLDIPTLSMIRASNRDFNYLCGWMLSNTAYLRFCALQGFPRQDRKLCWKVCMDSTRSEAESKQRYLRATFQIGSGLRDISVDVRRTLPQHPFFSDDAGVQSLSDVLNAFASCYPDVGYTQGMNYVCGFMLSQGLEEEECFWMLECLMFDYDLSWNFCRDLPLLSMLMWEFEQCLGIFLPQLKIHLMELSITPDSYAVDWFLSLYTYGFPTALGERVWDIFLLDRWKIVLQVGVALLASVEHKLLSLSFEDTLCALRSIKVRSVDTIIKRAASFPLSDELMGHLEGLYNSTIFAAEVD